MRDLILIETLLEKDWQSQQSTKGSSIKYAHKIWRKSDKFSEHLGYVPNGWHPFKVKKCEWDFRNLLIIQLQMMITWNDVLQEFYLKMKDIFMQQPRSFEFQSKPV